MWASSPGESGAVRITSICDETRSLGRIFALPLELVAALRHLDGVVLLVLEYGALLVDDQEGAPARRLAQHRGSRREGVCVAGQLAQREDDPMTLARRRCRGGRDLVDLA